jgi:F0F1-type ATP synthase assembly protein I
MIPWLGILFLPNFIFLYQLSRKRSQHAATNIIARSGRAGSLGLMIRNLDQKYDNINPDLEMKRKQQRDIVENLYKGKKILRLTFLFSIALFVVFVLFSLTYFA